MPDLSLVPKRPEYYVQVGSMFENPHGVPHDEIVAMIMEAPAEVVAQVVFGRYVESSGLVFSGELIQNMIDRTKPRIVGDSWVDAETRDFAKSEFRYSDPSSWPKPRYWTGIDFARQTDYTVLTTLDTSTRPARVVAFRRLNRVPWDSIYLEVGRVRALWGPNILVDSTGMAGDVILDQLDSLAYCPIHDRIVRDRECPEGNCGRRMYLSLSCCEGFSFQAGPKRELIEHLRTLLSEGYRRGSDEPYGAIRTPPIVQLEEEMSFYAWDDKRLETDCLMSLCLAAKAALDGDLPPIHIGA